MARGGKRSRRRAQGTVLAVVLLALSLLWTGAVVAQEAPPPGSPEGGGELSEPLEAVAEGEAAPAPEEGLQVEGARNPESDGPGSLLETNDGLLVEVFADRLDGEVVHALTDAGARIVSLDEATGVATVSAAPSELEAVADATGVRYVQEVLEPLTSAADGATVVQPPCGLRHSEGDAQLDAVGLRQDWDVEGLGVEVGILSDTWNRSTTDRTSLADDIASGDIPGAGNPCAGPGRTAAVPVLAEYQGPEPIDEGRGMAQLVHDLAPAAQLSYATAFNGEAAFANNIRLLRANGAHVIVDDVFYFREPAFQNGQIGVAVEEVVADGAAYFSAIGNENERIGGSNVSSYEAPAFRPTDCPAGITGTCHDFDPSGGVDATFGVGVADGGRLRMTLKWNEPFFGVTTDLDLYYLVGGEIAWSSLEANPIASKQPFEMIDVTAEDGPVAVDVVVRRKDTTPGTPRLKLDHVRSDLTSSERLTATGGDVMGPTSNGHSASPNGVGVGAVPYNNSNVPESFSNHGPATWYWEPVDGNTPAAALPGPLVLQKPDLAATDGAQTTFFYDAPPFDAVSRFYGTSAAAPHAAAVAALLIDCNPSLTPAQITSVLKATANPVSGGVPTNVGAGLIDARNAGAQVCLPPAPGPAFAVSDTSVVEGNGGLGGSKALAFTVTLSQAQTSATSVRYATADGTAVAGADYTAKGLTTLTFSAGQTSKVVKVTVKGDKVDEPDETVRLQLSSPVGVGLADALGVGTILDDDPTPVVPVLTVDDVSVLEGTKTLLGPNATITFTVRLSAPAPAGTSFRYRTADGDATAPGDYTAKGLTTVTVPTGATSRTITITLKSDAIAEPDEFFFVLLSDLVGLTLTGGDGAAAGFIRNDD